MQADPEIVPVISPQEPLLLRPPEAARTLAISEQQLWQLTKDKAIRAIRIGRSIRYCLGDLREFIAARKGARHGRDEAIVSSNA
jgi:excisionase family DNA binding protein